MQKLLTLSDNGKFAKTQHLHILGSLIAHERLHVLKMGIQKVQDKI